ncbi:MAG: hypothetical protein ACLTDX_03715 [[Clostridium] innocuum]
MEYINKNSITVDALCGRGLIRAVGKNSCFDSDKMTVGYALYKKSMASWSRMHMQRKP